MQTSGTALTSVNRCVHLAGLAFNDAFELHGEQ